MAEQLGAYRAMTYINPDELVTAEELLADPRVRRLLRKRGALKAHLAARAHNGLDACEAVRLTKTRRLLVHRERFVAWLFGLADEPHRDQAA